MWILGLKGFSQLSTHIGCSQGVVSGGTSSNAGCFSLLSSPVKVICTRGLPPTLVAVTFERTVCATRKFIRVIAAIISEITDLRLVDTSKVFTDILL